MPANEVGIAMIVSGSITGNDRTSAQEMTCQPPSERESLRQRLSATRVEVARRLKSVGIEPWLEPEAGMFLWCSLPQGVDAAELANAALAEKIVLAPGNVFSLSQSAQGSMRFNISQSQDKRLFDFLRAHVRRPQCRRS